MTLGNMRSNRVRSLAVSCWQCHHGAVLSADRVLYLIRLRNSDLVTANIQVGSTLLSAVVSPITTIAVVLLYFDLRVRKEGLDLDQLAQQTSPGPAPA